MLTSSCVKCWVEWPCKVHYKYLKEVYILVLQYIVISISLPYSSFSLFSLFLFSRFLCHNTFILSQSLSHHLLIYRLFLLSFVFIFISLPECLSYLTFSLCLLSLSLFLSHIIRICLADCLSARLCVSLFQCIYRLAVCISPLKFF